MRLTPISVLASALVLAACSSNTAEDRAAPAAAVDTAMAAPPASSAAPPAAVAPTDGMSAEEHAAMGAGTPAASAQPGIPGMDHANMPGMKTDAAAASAQAGWYRAGTFQPCGSSQTYRVSATGELDAKIRAADMSATDPVYVRLEGAAANGAFNLSRVAQVGSPTPVRDCPMTGTTTQG